MIIGREKREGENDEDTVFDISTSILKEHADDLPDKENRKICGTTKPFTHLCSAQRDLAKQTFRY